MPPAHVAQAGRDGHRWECRAAGQEGAGLQVVALWFDPDFVVHDDRMLRGAAVIGFGPGVVCGPDLRAIRGIEGRRG